MTKLTDYRKKLIATAMFEKQDIGGKSKEAAIKSVIENGNNKHDPLTTIMVNAIKEADDIEDISTNLDYAINQLRIARDNIQAF